MADPGFNPSADGMSFTSKAWASMPSASTSATKIFYCPDAPMGASIVLSDGISWRAISRGLYSAKVTLTAPMSGIASFTYPASFTILPNLHVTVSDIAGSGRLTYFVNAESVSGCDIKVLRGSALPGLLGSLVGFDPFGGGSTTGVIVHLTASPLS